jgi:DNA helicase-2/ATP-dependent DNA helicase PcrA
VVQIDEAVLSDPGQVISTLHDAWLQRRPFVIKLGVESDRFRAPETWQVEPWTLDARFEPWLDRLHFLVWANNYDARGGREPVWWWARKAARLGATTEGSADVLLPDGTPAWIDGGPRGPLSVDGTVVHADTVELGRLTPVPLPKAVTADLAPDQLAAVAHGAGPARIVAPAGSGKTRVLTERLRHLLVDRGYEREALLAVAYNKKAQLELESRCSDIGPRVVTLNALGYQLLGRPRLIEEREARRILDGLIPRRPKRVNTDPMAPYLEGFTSIRLGLRDPEEVEAERDDVPGLSDAFARYRQALNGAVDYDEQVYGAIELLLRDGEARRQAQASCRHLLVDELQDLTPAHVLLLRLLATPGLDVFGVGDDDQVIYGHAGADPSFLINFDDLFPGAADHPLEVNYRCPVAVVDAAVHLLSYNDRRVPKKIRPGASADATPDALTVRPAAELVRTVTGWLEKTKDVAVLTRVNSLLLIPHVALVEAGVSVSSSLPRDVLERTGTRAALAYLRLGASPTRMQPDDLVEVLRRPSRGFPQWITKWLRRTMSIDDLRAIAERIDDAKVPEKIRGFADDLARVASAVASGTTRQVFTVIADEIGLGGAMRLLDGSKGGQTASQYDDLDALALVADLHPDPITFESWLRDVLARPGDPDGVVLSTIHRVKGMEWDRVAVYGVHEGIVPHRLAEDVEEERRVLHVAITRCRHQVVVLTEPSRPSPFLGELDGTAPRGPARPQQARRGKPAAKASEVEARVGLSVEASGGFTGVIESFDKDGVMLRLGAGSLLRVRWDETVNFGGKQAALVRAPELPPGALAREEALRAWRTTRARADKVSAFIVASNALLRAIAIRNPATLEELATVDGIGPMKLDLYGEEILAALAEAKIAS